MHRIGTRVAAALAALLLAGRDAHSLEFSPADIYRSAADSVVLIFAYGPDGSGNSGTGSIITSRGLVLTNSHVIANRSTGSAYRSIVVYFKPDPITGDRDKDLAPGFRAEVMARNPSLDLAVLKLREVPHKLPVLPFGASERAQVGEPVAAIGHPGGGGLWTLTTGTISSIRKDQGRDVFQTDTAINPGNSGGPLIDANAQLIGINTFVRRQNARGLALEGLNYSIRGDFVRKWLGSQGIELAAGQQRARRAASQPPAAPAPAAPAAQPPADSGGAKKAEPREFRGPGGELMFGVPNPSLDLDAVRREIYERSRKNAKDAFDELDGDGFWGLPGDEGF